MRFTFNLRTQTWDTAPPPAPNAAPVPSVVATPIPSVAPSAEATP